MDALERFSAGDVVDVRQHGRATVIQVVAEPGHPHCGRVLVRYHEDGTTFYANPRKLRKMELSSGRVIVCYRTEYYRAAAVNNVERSDVCLEVGCHNGTTTRMLHNRCAFVVGIDNVSLMVEQARAKSPHVRFELADGFNVEEVRAVSPTGDYNKIFVDLSGKAPLAYIARLLGLYLDAFPSSKIIVKNEALYDYVEQAEQAQQGQEAQQGQQQAQVDSTAQAAAEDRCGGAAQQADQAAETANGGCCAQGDRAQQAEQAAGPGRQLAADTKPFGAQAAQGCSSDGGSNNSNNHQEALGAVTAATLAAAAAAVAGGAAATTAAASGQDWEQQLPQLAALCELYRSGYISNSIRHGTKGRSKAERRAAAAAAASAAAAAAAVASGASPTVK